MKHGCLVIPYTCQADLASTDLRFINSIFSYFKDRLLVIICVNA